MCGPLVVKACEYSFKGKFSWDDFHSEVKLSQLKDEVVDDLQQNLVQFLRHSDKYRSQFDEDELNYLKMCMLSLEGEHLQKKKKTNDYRVDAKFCQMK